MNTDCHLIAEMYRNIKEQNAMQGQPAAPTTPAVPAVPAAPSPSMVQSPQLQQNKLVDDVLNYAVVPYNKKMTFINFLNTLREYNATTGAMGTPQPQPAQLTQVSPDANLDKMLDSLLQQLGIPYPNKQRVYSTLMSLRGA